VFPTIAFVAKFKILLSDNLFLPIHHQIIAWCILQLQISGKTGQVARSSVSVQAWRQHKNIFTYIPIVSGHLVACRKVAVSIADELIETSP
jgi:hypothetical protein